MQATFGTTVIRNAATLATFSLFLSGCLSGETADTGTQLVEITNHVTGSVGDGPISGSSMRVLRNDGAVLNEFVSDTVADFDIAVTARDGDYPLTIEARDGIDLVTNLAPDFTLFGLIPESRTSTTANVNPFTTFTVEIAKDLPGGLTAANFDAAEQIVVTSLNSGLTSLVATGPSGTQINAGNIAEIVKASEALAETVRRTRDWLQTFGTVTSGNDVIRELASDLVDSVRDGIGGPRTDARTAAISSIVSVQVLLETMSNELHVNDVDATGAMNAAIDHVMDTTPTSGIGDQTVTAQMLDTVRVGLDAAFAVTSSPKVAELQQIVSGIPAGMDFMLIRTLLPDDYRATLDSVLMAVAGGDISVTNTINNVVRNGGGEPAANRAPTITGTPATTIASGVNYLFVPFAADADGDTVEFSISDNMPVWASFNTVTGALSGIPIASDVGSYPDIVISATDGMESVDLAPFTITVTLTNSAPTITGTPPAQVNANSPYSFTPIVNDADGNDLMITVSGLPIWASFNDQDGSISGTPADVNVGTFNGISIMVSDGTANATLGPFSITVVPVNVNAAPTITGTPPAQVNANSAYAFTPIINDADGDDLTITVSGLPAWASFNDQDGSISGTPGDANVGTDNGISIMVSDGTANATLGPFSITVVADNSNAAPTITGTPATQVNANTPYSFTPIVNDVDGDDLTITVSGLPVWATFNDQNGSISGTPGDAHVNTYNGISITVSDGTADATLGPFTITVNAVSLGSVTLNWTPPLLNEDGSDLDDLAGYKFYWGTTPGSYPNSVTVTPAGMSSYVIENLAPGTYEFVATAFNDAGVESVYSNPATKTVP